MRVLVVDDDENMRIAVAGALRGAGLAVDPVPDLPDADEALAVNAYDCVVFDRVLPEGDALRYVERRRQAGWDVPVLFLTGMDAVRDRIAGLNWGNDYLVKPFAMDELVARVRSLCRDVPDGATQAGASASMLRWQDLELDPVRHEARRGGAELRLTPKEFVVLQRLLAAAGQAVGRAELIAAAWDEYVRPTANVLDVLVVQLRRKLGYPPVLHTVRGVGYLLGEPRG